MKHTFKYTLTALALLLSTTVFAQTAMIDAYHDEGKGIATSKSVSEQNEDGSYTLTLETFAKGSSTVVQRSIPADIVLVLDVSSSMGGRRGTFSKILNETPLTYNDVVRGYDPRFPDAPNYIIGKVRDSGEIGTPYQLFALERNNKYYLYWLHTDGYILFLDSNGNDVRATGIIDTSKSECDIDNVRVPSGAAEAGSKDATIVTIPDKNDDQDHCRFFTGSSRIRDLKEAVGAFIDEIDTNDQTGPDGNPRPGGRLGNRISIITFSGYEYGDDCSARLNAPLTQLTEETVDDLKDIVANFSLDSGTRPNDGFSHGTYGANHQFATSGRTGTIGEDYSRTIVFFTDGQPDGTASDASSNWNTTIASAHDSKTTYGANVFSVLLLSSQEQQGTDTWKFMNYTSSNYPEATSLLTDPGAGGDSGFYQDASGETINLASIFRAIAHASGGSATTAGATTQVRDIVSSSFKLPIDTSKMTEEQIQAWAADNVKVYTSRIGSDGKSWHSLHTLTDAVVNVEGAQITVSGFDFTKPDIKDENGYTPQSTSNYGNWVGKRYSSANNSYYAGYKLVVKFPIFAIDDATGGNNSATNTKESGVYVWNSEGQVFENVNSYEVPITNVPINLVIEKTGLRHGQSATFEIERCRPKNWVEGAPLADNLRRLEHNDYGKPIPNENWENWSKVVLTNKGADGAKVTKTLRSMDAGYVYRIVEDKWGWSYDVEGAKINNDYPNTSNQLTNPFRFHNVEKTDAVKHAEAVVINHFATSSTNGETNNNDARVEGSYKSSKVESFESTNPITSGNGN